MVLRWKSEHLLASFLEEGYLKGFTIRSVLHIHEVGLLVSDRLKKEWSTSTPAEVKSSRLLVPSMGQTPKTLDPTLFIRQLNSGKCNQTNYFSFECKSFHF